MVSFKRAKINSRQPRRSASDNSRVSSTNYYRPKKQPINTTAVQDKSNIKTRKISFSNILNNILMLVIVGLLLFSTTLSSVVDVRLNKSDFQYRDISEYTEVANEIINKSITNKSKLLFRSSDFEQEMINRFPEISLIDAIMPIAGRSLSVSVRVSEPLALVSSGGENGVVDNSGVLVSTNNGQTKGLLKLRFASPQSNFTVGSRLITNEEVYLLKLIALETSLIALNNTERLTVDEILFNVADGQLEVRLKEVQFYLKFSAYADPDEQVGAVKATLGQLDREGMLPTKYLDVRVPGRVFVL